MPETICFFFFYVGSDLTRARAVDNRAAFLLIDTDKTSANMYRQTNPKTCGVQAQCAAHCVGNFCQARCARGARASGALCRLGAFPFVFVCSLAVWYSFWCVFQHQLRLVSLLRRPVWPACRVFIACNGCRRLGAHHCPSDCQGKPINWRSALEPTLNLMFDIADGQVGQSGSWSFASRKDAWLSGCTEKSDSSCSSCCRWAIFNCFFVLLFYFLLLLFFSCLKDVFEVLTSCCA